MRKGLLLLVLAIVCGMAGRAESVSRTEALQKAKAFMQGKGIGVSRQMTEVARAPRKKAGQISAPCYYVFNADRGFVIVSGDDRTVPVLGYSLSGNFNPDSIPANMRAWLQGYADLIDNLDSLGVTAKYDEADATVPAKAFKSADGRLSEMNVQKVKSVVTPLLTSTWNQSEPYNLNCPPFLYNGSYYRSVTGCVATAMAQVVNYHKYPNAIVADIPAYVTNTYKTSVSGIPAGSVIDWANMADNYDSYQYMTTASNQAVANLMLYCGVSVQMDYASSSGAQSGNVARALKQYFGYDENVYCAQRSNYTIAEWDALLINELMNNRPIVYGAQSTGGGHEFVLDGYDGDLYHVNWGWGGYCDGYFAVSVLNPHSTEGIGASSTPDGYSMDQDATIGVQPPGYPNPAMPDNTYSDRLCSKNLHVEDTYVCAEFHNLTGETHDFDIGYTFVNLATNTEFTINLGTGTLMPFYYYPRLGIDVSGLTQPGTYKVYPVSRINGTDEWLSCIDENRYYVIVNISDTVLTEVHPLVNLSVSDFDVPKTPTVGRSQIITAKINNSGEEYNGNLYFISRVEDETEYSLFGRTGVAILEGGSTDVTLYMTPEVAKDHYIYISTVAPNDDGTIDETKIIGECLLTFDGEVPVVDLEVVSAGIYNEPIAGEDFDFYVSIKNNGDDYSGPLYLFYVSERMYEEENLIYRGMHYDKVSIAAGETADVDFSFLPDETGEYYFWIGTDSEAQNIIAQYSVTVGERIPDIDGDINGDGRLDVADLVALSKYISDGDLSNVQVDKADLTGDGRITVADVVELARRIANQ